MKYYNIMFIIILELTWYWQQKKKGEGGKNAYKSYMEKERRKCKKRHTPKQNKIDLALVSLDIPFHCCANSTSKGDPGTLTSDHVMSTVYFPMWLGS